MCTSVNLHILLMLCGSPNIMCSSFHLLRDQFTPSDPPMQQTYSRREHCHRRHHHYLVQLFLAPQASASAAVHGLSHQEKVSSRLFRRPSLLPSRALLGFYVHLLPGTRSLVIACCSIAWEGFTPARLPLPDRATPAFRTLSCWLCF